MLPILLGAGLVVVASLLKQYKTVENFQAAGSGNTDSLEGLSDDLQAKLLISSRATAQQSLKDLQEYKTTNGQQWMLLPQSERDNVEAGANVLRNFIKNVPATTTASTLPLIREQLGDLQTYMVALRRSFDIVQTSINKPSQAAIEANTYLTHTLNVIKAFLYFIDTNESTIMGAFEDPTEVQGVEMEVKKTKDHLSTTRDEILGMQKSVDEYDKLTAKQQANLLNQLYETANPIVSHYAEAQVFVKEIKSGEFQKRREEERQRQAEFEQMQKVIDTGAQNIQDPSTTYRELSGMILEMLNIYRENRKLLMSVYNAELDKSQLEQEINDCIQTLLSQQNTLLEIQGSIKSFLDLPKDQQRQIVLTISEMFSRISSDYSELTSYVKMLKAQKALSDLDSGGGSESGGSGYTGGGESGGGGYTGGGESGGSGYTGGGESGGSGYTGGGESGGSGYTGGGESGGSGYTGGGESGIGGGESGIGGGESGMGGGESGMGGGESGMGGGESGIGGGESGMGGGESGMGGGESGTGGGDSSGNKTLFPNYNDSSGNEQISNNSGDSNINSELSLEAQAQLSEYKTLVRTINAFIMENNLTDNMVISGLDSASQKSLQELNGTLSLAQQAMAALNMGKLPTSDSNILSSDALEYINRIVIPGKGEGGPQPEGFSGYRGVQGFQNYRLQGFQNFQLGRREGFQSRGNPYNQASPSLQQAQEFRLEQMNLSRQTGNFAR